MGKPGWKRVEERDEGVASGRGQVASDKSGGLQMERWCVVWGRPYRVERKLCKGLWGILSG